MIITLFDALEIQSYLFSSNRLKDNIGASWLVQEALEKWPRQALNNAGLSEEHLMVSGGGNSMFFFDSLEQARNMACRYSQLLHERAPGLQVACHHHEVSMNNSAEFCKELEKAYAGLHRKKASRLPGQPLLGMGVTQLCETGNQEPATEVDTEKGSKTRLLGPAALAKIKGGEKAKTELAELYKEQIKSGCVFPSELDDLGRSLGEKSYIGVVHMDGNGIGELIRKIREQAKSPDAFKKEIHDFSKKINSAGTTALRSAVELLCSNVQISPDGQAECASISLKRNNKEEICLPFRPLVFGGDDITFVCDGRIALDLAVEYLEKFHNESGEHACAGVAFIKSHYPFSRGYDLAEQLCRNGKRFLKNKRKKGSTIDWHFLAGGTVPEIEIVRKREYSISILRKELDLTCRPYLVHPDDPTDLRSWRSFRNELLLKLQQDEKWQKSHSRLKRLRQILIKGPDAADLELKDWEIKKFSLPNYTNFTGNRAFLDGKKTPYIDAIELLDFMIPLERQSQSTREGE